MIKIFLLNLIINCKEKYILERSAALTLRVLLAFFPFLIFLMALMGFLNLDTGAIMRGLYYVLPAGVTELVSYIVVELFETRRPGLMSAALAFSVYNTMNGLRAVIRVINLSFGRHERRGFFMQVMLAFVLMLLFSAAIIIMLVLLVFGRQILGFFFPQGHTAVFTAVSGLAAVVVLLYFTVAIYKVACARPLRLKEILPGASFTVVAWIAASAVIGYVTQNFMQFSAIYGSIAGMFILILWLNAVNISLLLGNEINALLWHFRASPDEGGH